MDFTGKYSLMSTACVPTPPAHTFSTRDWDWSHHTELYHQPVYFQMVISSPGWAWTPAPGSQLCYVYPAFTADTIFCATEDSALGYPVYFLQSRWKQGRYIYCTKVLEIRQLRFHFYENKCVAFISQLQLRYSRRRSPLLYSSHQTQNIAVCQSDTPHVSHSSGSLHQWNLLPRPHSSVWQTVSLSQQ